MKQEKYFISGASGFIGGSLLSLLNQRGIQAVGIGRTYRDDGNYFQCDLFDQENIKNLLKGVTCVVHCAGYAHAFHAHSAEVKDSTWKVNYVGAKQLAQLSTQMGVSKFIHLSSVKAMGEAGAQCIDESRIASPETDYGKSKLAAENILTEIGHESGMQVVNLRLAMVYGAGGKGNLERMARLVSKNQFPPLPETHNHRSMIYIDDVLDVILCVSQSNKAIEGPLIVASNEAPSGRGLFDALRAAYGMKPLTFQVPKTLLNSCASMGDLLQHVTGKKMPFNREILSRLLDSEWYSSKKLQTFLNWSPKVSLQEGLAKMVGTK